MTEFERDEIYRKVADSTSELKRLCDESKLDEQMDELERVIQRANERRARRRARQVFAASNVPESDRIRTTFGGSVKTTLIGVITPLLFVMQGVFR